jgi:hypothetical protein
MDRAVPAPAAAVSRDMGALLCGVGQPDLLAIGAEISEEPTERKRYHPG